MNIPPEFTFTAIGTTSAGAQELIAAAASKTARIHGLMVIPSGACTVRLESGSSVGSTDLALIGGAIPVAANAYLSVPFERTVEGAVPGTVALNLQVGSTAAVTLSGWAFTSSSSY